MIVVGIDAGAATTKALVIKEKEIAGYTINPTGFDFKKAARLRMKMYCQKSE